MLRLLPLSCRDQQRFVPLNYLTNFNNFLAYCRDPAHQRCLQSLFCCLLSIAVLSELLLRCLFGYGYWAGIMWKRVPGHLLRAFLGLQEASLQDLHPSSPLLLKGELLISFSLKRCWQSSSVPPLSVYTDSLCL